MEAKVTIDWTKKQVVITAPLSDLRSSSTGETESMVNIKNEGIGQNHATDGRPLKMSLLLYVRQKDISLKKQAGAA